MKNPNDLYPTDKYEQRKRADMSIRDVAYGFYRVATEPIPILNCELCGLAIHGRSVRILGALMHEGCFNESRQNNS